MGFEVELRGAARLDFLRRFPPFERCIPSHDTLDGVTKGVDAELLELCRAGWVDTLRDGLPDVAAVVLRQAQDEGQDVAPLPREGRGTRAAPARVGLGGASAPDRSCRDTDDGRLRAGASLRRIPA